MYVDLFEFYYYCYRIRLYFVKMESINNDGRCCYCRSKIHYGLTSDSFAEHTIEKRPANSGKRAPGAKSNSQVPTPLL